MTVKLNYSVHTHTHIHTRGYEQPVSKCQLVENRRKWLLHRKVQVPRVWPEDDRIIVGLPLTFRDRVFHFENFPMKFNFTYKKKLNYEKEIGVNLVNPMAPGGRPHFWNLNRTIDFFALVSPKLGAQETTHVQLFPNRLFCFCNKSVCSNQTRFWANSFVFSATNVNFCFIVKQHLHRRRNAS